MMNYKGTSKNKYLCMKQPYNIVVPFKKVPRYKTYIAQKSCERYINKHVWKVYDNVFYVCHKVFK